MKKAWLGIEPVGLLGLMMGITLLLSWRYQSLFILLGLLLATYLLIILMIIDFKQRLLPDNLTLSLLWLGLLFNLNGALVDLADAVLGAVVGYLSLWSLYWLVKLTTGVEGIGYGDFKLTAALGAWFGWQVLSEIVLLGTLLGLCSISVIFLFKDRSIVRQTVPLGSYLSLAGLLFLLNPWLFEERSWVNLLLMYK